MNEQRADILSLFNIDRHEIFAAANSRIMLVDSKYAPCGEIYYKNNHFGVRFGDYHNSSHYRVLS